MNVNAGVGERYATRSMATSGRRVGSRGRQSRDGEAGDDVGDLTGEPALGRLVVARPDGLDDDPADLAHLVFTEAARRRRRRAQPDATGRVGRVLVERDA